MSFFIIKKLVCLVTYHHRRENENRCFLPFHGCSVLLRAEWPTPLLAVRGGKGTGNLSAHQVCYPMPEGSYHLISHCLFHHKAPWRGLITCGSRRFGSTTYYRPRGSVSGGSSWHQRLDIYMAHLKMNAHVKEVCTCRTTRGISDRMRMRHAGGAQKPLCHSAYLLGST
jgi:hypothetical protein